MSYESRDGIEFDVSAHHLKCRSAIDEAGWETSIEEITLAKGIWVGLIL